MKKARRSSRGRILAIMYAEFDPIAGPKLAYQVPEAYAPIL